MSLPSGARLGPYEVVAPLGAGAMGEVYRARDSRLGRDVAIKVLPLGVAHDAERLRRFEYEARAAAALNHPNILAVFDIGEHDGSPYIVSELLDGATLRERLQGSAIAPLGGTSASEETPLPVRKALELAIQIANGLAAAHEKGIVHRDLKPENIFVTNDGRAKILDFGLAKLTQPEPVAASDSVPTNPGTQPGLLLGTVAYMSPEQIRGLPADHRSDIFSFGNILYEILSGRRAFQRESIADTMAAILKEHPPELSTLDRRIPSSVVRIVERCLEKSPAARFQSTHDLAFSLVGAVTALSDVGTVSGGVAAASSRRRPQLWMVAALVLLVTTLGLAAALFSQRPEEPEGTLRLSVAVPRGVFQINPMIRVSPDGNRLLFAAMGSDRVSRLWMRPLNALDASPISGTEGASYPFWSPDGRALGFFADGKLKKIDVAGGNAVALCDAPTEAGGTWNTDGVIIFSSLGRLHRISENGGVATSLNMVNEETGESTLAHPLFLPNGRQYLYLDTGTGGVGEPKIYASALDSKDRKLIVAAASNVWYSQGYLFYLRSTTVMAQPFNPDRLELSGDPVPIAEEVQTAPAGAPRGAFAVSDRTLAYMTGIAARGIPSQLTWLDRNGKSTGTLGEQEDYGDVSLSPTGSRVAVSVLDPPKGRDIWIFDVERGVPTRFTLDPADDVALIWSPDESQVVFASRRKGHLDLFQRASSGTGGDRELIVDSFDKYPMGWSSDGRYLLYSTGSQSIVGNQSDLWVRPWDTSKPPFPALNSAYSEYPGQFSPDGKWILYTSNESGRPEIYAVAFPGLDHKTRISTAGGNWPRWRRNGAEIFYLSFDNKMMSASVTQGATLVVGSAKALFDVRVPPGIGYRYDVTADGQRFLVSLPVERPPLPSITLVVNWLSELRRQ